MKPATAELPIPAAPSMPGDSGTRTNAPYFEITDDDAEILRAGLPVSAKQREQDCLTWWRELPRLLAAGEEGRYALIESGKLVSVWDTHNDAIQAGYDKFGVDRPFMTPQVEKQDLERLQQYLEQQKAKRCPT